MINTSKLNVGNIAQDHLNDNVKIKIFLRLRISTYTKEWKYVKISWGLTKAFARLITCL